ncbi:MAG: aspartate/glutamate racemase family protein [Pseudomonadota bacterium]
MQQRGGKTVYGASVGILMLETRFPRIPGDIGNAGTWPFPVHYRVAEGATPDNVVRGDPLERLDAFIEAGRALVAMGCDGITTNCGFLSLLQEPLKQALGVPVASSALMQAGMIQRLLAADTHVGIVTISANTLTSAHLLAAGVPQDVPVIGTDGGVFTRDVLGDAYTIDFEACRSEVVEAGVRLVRDHPATGAILLECTNMVPFAPDVRQATGLPVYSIYTLVQWFQAGLTPQVFPGRIWDARHADHPG